MRHEGPFFLFKSEKKTDEGQLKQMRQVPENLFFFFFGLRDFVQALESQLSMFYYSVLVRSIQNEKLEM